MRVHQLLPQVVPHSDAMITMVHAPSVHPAQEPMSIPKWIQSEMTAAYLVRR
jgi:hypothetical protein